MREIIRFYNRYKCERSIVANESRSGRSSQVYLRNENEIPFFREFPFPKPTSRSHGVTVRNTFVAVGYNIRRSLNNALFWHN